MVTRAKQLTMRLNSLKWTSLVRGHRDNDILTLSGNMGQIDVYTVHTEVWHGEFQFRFMSSLASFTCKTISHYSPKLLAQWNTSKFVVFFTLRRSSTHIPWCQHVSFTLLYPVQPQPHMVVPLAAWGDWLVKHTVQWRLPSHFNCTHHSCN